MRTRWVVLGDWGRVLATPWAVACHLCNLSPYFASSHDRLSWYLYCMLLVRGRTAAGRPKAGRVDRLTLRRAQLTDSASYLSCPSQRPHTRTLAVRSIDTGQDGGLTMLFA